MNQKDWRFTTRPCAAVGLISYRARRPEGWIMIGAADNAEALCRAQRNIPGFNAADLEVWDGTAYTPVNWPAAA